MVKCVYSSSGALPFVRGLPAIHGLTLKLKSFAKAANRLLTFPWLYSVRATSIIVLGLTMTTSFGTPRFFQKLLLKMRIKHPTFF